MTQETPVRTHSGILSVLNKTGDTTVAWNGDVDDEVEAARQTFDGLRAKGYMAYSTTAGGRRGEQIRTFDPAAERIVLVPPMQGG